MASVDPSNAVSPVIGAPVVDWATTPLSADYAGHYVKIIDNLFLPEECAELIALAESNAEWEQAAVNYGLGPNDKYIDTSYRDGFRILRFDRSTADRLYERLKPHVQELYKIGPGDRWEGIVDFPGHVDGVWECVGYVL